MLGYLEINPLHLCLRADISTICLKGKSKKRCNILEVNALKNKFAQIYFEKTEARILCF